MSRSGIAAMLVAVLAVAGLLVLLGPPFGDGLNSTGEQTVATVDPRDVYDPVSAGEALPRGYRTVVSRDLIAPIYRPAFVPADEVEWPDEMLVIGVAVEGQAKAYPVLTLNHREMVNDRLAGIPILVTW